MKKILITITYINIFLTLTKILVAQEFSDQFQSTNDSNKDGSYSIGSLCFSSKSNLLLIKDSSKNIDETLVVGLNVVIDAIAVSPNNQYFAVLTRQASNSQRSRILVKKLANSEISEVFANDEELFIREVYAISNSGNFVLTNCGKKKFLDEIKKNYTVQYLFFVFDISSKTNKQTSINQWCEYLNAK